MLEGDVIAGTPGELCAKAGEDTILDVTLRGDVSDFLLGGLKRFKAWVELPELKGAEARPLRGDAPRQFVAPQVEVLQLGQLAERWVQQPRKTTVANIELLHRAIKTRDDADVAYACARVNESVTVSSGTKA